MKIILERNVTTATQKYLKNVEYDVSAEVFAQIGQFTACCMITNCEVDCDDVAALKQAYLER